MNDNHEGFTETYLVYVDSHFEFESRGNPITLWGNPSGELRVKSKRFLVAKLQSQT